MHPSNFKKQSLSNHFIRLVEQISAAVDPNEVSMQIKIIDALNEEEKKDPTVLLSKAFKVIKNHKRFAYFKAKQRITQATGCTPQDINRLVEKYSVMQHTYAALFALKKSGKPMPTTVEDMRNLLMNLPKHLKKK